MTGTKVTATRSDIIIEVIYAIPIGASIFPSIHGRRRNGINTIS
jgi:hypothetical protein